MNTILIILLCISSTFAGPYRLYMTEGTPFQNIETEYRLPSIQVPSGYVISLVVGDDIFTGERTNFNGTVQVTFSVINVTNTILIHSPGEIPVSSITIVQPGSTSSIVVSGSTFNATTEILTITFQQNLAAFISYTLSMNYTAQLDTTEMRGFYRSSYVNSNGQTEYLLTTQFQPTHARKAFPCFDEPSFKASFQLIITHPSNMTAMFNAASQNQATLG